MVIILSIVMLTVNSLHHERADKPPAITVISTPNEQMRRFPRAVNSPKVVSSIESENRIDKIKENVDNFFKVYVDATHIDMRASIKECDVYACIVSMEPNVPTVTHGLPYYETFIFKNMLSEHGIDRVETQVINEGENAKYIHRVFLTQPKQ